MEWPMYRRVERQATRLHEMMDKLDVNAADVARLRKGDAYAESRTTCLGCLNTHECFTWLDAKPPSRKAPVFCPNFALFQSCKNKKT